jgi:hypothetical protein
MASQEQKRRAGEALMAVGFVEVTFSLPFVPLNFISRFLSSYGLTTTQILAISGTVGFLIFAVGFELWERNRTHINDV